VHEHRHKVGKALMEGRDVRVCRQPKARPEAIQQRMGHLVHDDVV
jgi:hypothetical protein